MDKKNFLMGLACLLVAFGFLMLNGPSQPDPAAPSAPAPAEQATAPGDPAAPSADGETPMFRPGEGATPTPNPDAAENFARPVADAPLPSTPEAFATLRNDHITVTLTNYGGAIHEVTLENFADENPREVEDTHPVRLTNVAQNPMMGLSRPQGDGFVPVVPVYTLESATDARVVYAAQLANGLVVRRTYSLVKGDAEGPAPFEIRHETTLSNPTTQAFALDDLYLHLGTASPTDADRMGFNLNASYYRNGDYNNIASSQFRPGGFPFYSEAKARVSKEGPLNWGAVKNQFFVQLYTPDIPAREIVARGVEFPIDPVTQQAPVGVTAALRFAGSTIEPGTSLTLAGDYYAGPKSFARLSKLDGSQESTLQLGWFMFLHDFFLISFVAKSLLSFMGWLQGLFGNWGWTIIAATLCIRGVLYPLTAKAAKAGKRMQKLAGPMKEIQEKYKDDPTKLQQEMLKFYTEHKFNPMSGCWPVLIQFPIFIGFFNLLRNTAELRHAPFLWIHDLSMPDATIGLGDIMLPLGIGNAINVLPFIWLVSMWFQMKLMPTPPQAADNPAYGIMKYMPFIFFPFTYAFSSGLVLYWTTTNCFSILQTWWIHRQRDEEDIKIEAELKEREDQKLNKTKKVGPLISKKKKKDEGNGPHQRR